MKLSVFKLLAIVACSIFIFSSCHSGKVKVGLLMHSLTNERWNRDRDNIIAEVEALGGEVIFRNANDDQSMQNKQAEELLEEGADVLIVVASDQNNSAEIVKLAHEEGVKVIAYDRLMRECDLDFYITTNSVRVGEIQAEYMLSQYPRGNYGLIIGDEHDNNSLLLFLGQMNVLQQHVESGEVRIVYSEYTKSWTSDEGYEKAKDMLSKSNGKVDVVLCGSDAIAYGVNKALDEAGLTDSIAVISQDAELEIVRCIAEGKHEATILKPLNEMAHKSAEVAIKLARHKKLEKDYTTVSNGKRLVPSYELEPKLVNRDNISATVVAEGFHTSQEIFSN